MFRRIQFSPFIRFALLLCLSSLVACQAQTQPTREPFKQLENEELQAVPDGGQMITKGDLLHIGVGNIRPDTYTNAEGKEVSGFTVALWLSFEDHPEWLEKRRVYEGQAFELHGYHIRAISINEDDRMVVLGVIPPTK